jgi:hypothetical protein
MIKTCIYIFGTLALHLTDFTHPNAFFSTFLPLIDALFLIFLIWQLMFFLSLNDFSDGQEHNMSELLMTIYDLSYEMQEQGIVPALFNLALSLFDALCVFVSIYYFLNIMLELITR